MNITELCVNCKQNNSCTMCWKTSKKKCPHFIQRTNADRIRAMSDEDLAWELMTWRIETEAKHHGVESNYPNTKSAILEWLKQPSKGE